MELFFIKFVNGKIKCRNSVNYFVGFPTFLYVKIYIREDVYIMNKTIK